LNFENIHKRSRAREFTDQETKEKARMDGPKKTNISFKKIMVN